MNRAEATKFVWALAEAAKPLHSKASLAWLCTKIGAGDQEEAIIDLLRLLADCRVILAPELVAPLADWMSGYANSDDASKLAALANRLGLPSVPLPTWKESSPAASPWHGRARRVRFDSIAAIRPPVAGAPGESMRYVLDQEPGHASATPTVA